jgi:ATP-binding cassette, subfamily B, bacterial
LTAPVPQPRTTQELETYNLKGAIADNRLLGLFRLMEGYRKYYAGAIISLAFAVIGRTLSLLILAYFVDDVLDAIVQGEDPMTKIPGVALAFLALWGCFAGFVYISGRLAAYTSEHIAWRVRNYLYDHIQRLSFTYHDNMKTGELLQRATSDVEAMRRFFAEQGVGIGRIVILFTVNVTAVMTISVSLALYSIIIIPFMVIVSLFFFRKISKVYEAFQEQEANLSTVLQENLSGVRVVKAFARQDYETNKFEHENHEKFLRGKELITLHSVYWPITDTMTGGQEMFGFLVAGLMTIEGTITVGQYVAYVAMMHSIVEPMRQLGRLIVQVATGFVSYDRVMEIVKEERETLRESEVPPVKEIVGEVVFDHVSFRYSEDMPVLDDVSFHCAPGQTIALLGGTGSGKSSLLALLPRFYRYNEGSIRLDGIELFDYPRAFLRQNIGVVEQEPFLFSRTIRENITYSVGREVSDEEVFEAARAAVIHDVIEGFPEGYDTLVGERGVTLSGGQKQRLVLARTLLKNPRILILDDATSSVDTETEAEIRAALNDMMSNRTSFIIAHRIQTVMHADLILVMDNGRIVQSGTHEELLQEEGIYRDTHDIQARVETELEEELASA